MGRINILKNLFRLLFLFQQKTRQGLSIQSLQPGDGLYVRDWIYVDDHVRTIDLILQKGTIGETYLIGGIEKDISNIDVVKRILKTMGKDEKLISHVTDRPGHDRRYAIDASKIKRELGWVPQHDFDTALKLTVDWYLAHPAWLS